MLRGPSSRSVTVELEENAHKAAWRRAIRDVASFGLTEQDILSGKAGHRSAATTFPDAVSPVGSRVRERSRGSASNGDGLHAAAAQGSGRDPPARAQFRWSSPAG